MAASRLPAIVKLSGSFAAGGLLFSELNSDTVEGLPSLKNLLLPTQAHAFSLPTFKLKSAPPRPRVQPYIALDDSGNCVKVYPSELRLQSYWSQFRVATLAAATCRGVFFTYYMMIDEHFKNIRESEEEARLEDKDWEFSTDAPPFDYELAWSKGPAALLAIVRELLVGLSRVFLSRLAVDHLDRALAWKLVKDLVSSLRAKRRFPFYQRAYLVPRTYIRGTLITTLAEFFISTVIGVARVAVIWWEGEPLRPKLRELRHFLVITACRQVTILVASSAGAGLVGTVRPGVMCSWAALGAGLAMDAFVCQPAVRDYQEKRYISTGTKFIMFGSLTAVGCCFLPWLGLPNLDSFRGRQQAVQFG